MHRGSIGGHHKLDLRIPVSLIFFDDLPQHRVQRPVVTFEHPVTSRSIWADTNFVDIHPSTHLLEKVGYKLRTLVAENPIRHSKAAE